MLFSGLEVQSSFQMDTPFWLFFESNVLTACFLVFVFVCLFAFMFFVVVVFKSTVVNEYIMYFNACLNSLYCNMPKRRFHINRNSKISKFAFLSFKMPNTSKRRVSELFCIFFFK